MRQTRLLRPDIGGGGEFIDPSDCAALRAQQHDLNADLREPSRHQTRCEPQEPKVPSRMWFPYAHGLLLALVSWRDRLDHLPHTLHTHPNILHLAFSAGAWINSPCGGTMSGRRGEDAEKVSRPQPRSSSPSHLFPEVASSIWASARLQSRRYPDKRPPLGAHCISAPGVDAIRSDPLAFLLAIPC